MSDRSAGRKDPFQVPRPARAGNRNPSLNRVLTMQERLTPYQIKVQVAREFGVDPSEFDKTCHSRRMVDAKHEAIARIHEAHRDLSLAQIARYFGTLDHTSVINA